MADVNRVVEYLVPALNDKGYTVGETVEGLLLTAATLCEELGQDLTPEERDGMRQTGMQLGARFYEGGPYVVAGALRAWAKLITEEGGRGDVRHS